VLGPFPGERATARHDYDVTLIRQHRDGAAHRADRQAGLAGQVRDRRQWAVRLGGQPTVTDALAELPS
jgi:hypothetical protein